MAKSKSTPPQLTADDVAENIRLNDADHQLPKDWEPGSESGSALDEKKSKAAKGGKKEKTPPPPPRKRQPIEIRSGKIVKELFCHFTYDQNMPNFVTNEITCKSGIPIHEDMRPTFDRFVPHLAAIFEEIDEEQFQATQPFSDGTPAIESPTALLALLGDFSIVGFKLDEYDDEETIILIGERTLKCGVAQLITPAIRFINSQYQFVDKLRKVTDDVLFEINEYLQGRKRAPDQQLDMFQHGEDL